MKKIGIFLSFILPALVFSEQADHLLLSQIVVNPDEAESISIVNPTDEIINLSDYYICDDKDYYQMQTDDDLSPSHFINGFTAQFPDIVINPNDTLLLVLNEDYASFYTDITPDLFLFDWDNSMLETEDGSFGNSASAKLDDDNESIILFKWSGNTGDNIEDIDYFIWGGIQGAIDKTDAGDYLNDTPAENQMYFEETHGDYYAFSRISSLEEIDEIVTGGNGIIGHDETSENFRESWEIIPVVEIGCMDSEAENYNPNATIDDGSCYNITSIDKIVFNCDEELGESLTCDGSYNLSSESADGCPLYEETITTTGLIVDYFDITPFGGPHSFTIQDDFDNLIAFVIWPESSEYQDGFDITQSEINYITQAPFGTYEVIVTGVLGAYCDDDELLNIYNEWQLTVEYEENIAVIVHEIVIPEDLRFEVDPYPFVPSRGQEISYTYSIPNGYRCVIRIFDISGRFIDTRFEGVPVFFDIPEKTETWDGRNQLGELSPPGVYLMHFEATEVSTGKSFEEIAPIVIGVPVQ